MPTEHALVVPFPGLVDLVGIPNDLPPHVTVLYPCAGDVQAIGEVLAPFEAFDVTFRRLDRFPGTLWLAPEPAEPFRRMTEAMVARFPDHQPYGGAFDSIIPHLTVAHARLDETEPLVEQRLPLRSRVASVVLFEGAGPHWREAHTFAL